MDKVPDNWWTNGLCSNFALALHQRFGGEMWAVVDHSQTYPEDDYLLHAYCVIDGKAYDANGSHELADVSDLSTWSVIDNDPESATILQWREVDVAWFDRNHEDFSLEYLPDANDYIDRHIHLFTALDKSNN